MELGALIVTEYGDPGLAGHTGGKFAGQIFLDGYLLLQTAVPADVGDTEAAEAQHLTNDVTIMQQGARFNVDGFLSSRTHNVATVRTQLILVIKQLHAA